ncbi:hypothetical protein D3C73_1251230 [compost metagenome]
MRTMDMMGVMPAPAANRRYRARRSASGKWNAPTGPSISSTVPGLTFWCTHGETSPVASRLTLMLKVQGSVGELDSE